MQNTCRADQMRAPQPTARLRGRRLMQGCAILLLLPSAAAFLPVFGVSPKPSIALHPVNLPLRTSAQAASRPSLIQTAASATHRKLARLAGLASWYGSVLDGHKTASGEIFDPHALTACHPTLPFGTLVRVVNLVNHKSVLVRINDRGVLNKDRVIDLSSAAAMELDMLRSGVAPVRLEVQHKAESKTPEATPPVQDASS